MRSSTSMSFLPRKHQYGFLLTLAVAVISQCPGDAFLVPTRTTLQPHLSPLRVALRSSDDRTESEGAPVEVVADLPGAEESTGESAPPSSLPRQQFRQQQEPPRAKDLMMAMGTTPRRLFLGAASATGIALAGNFLGVTSRLLTLFPEESVEATGLDTYFPRGASIFQCTTTIYKLSNESDPSKQTNRRL